VLGLHLSFCMSLTKISQTVVIFCDWDIILPTATVCWFRDGRPNLGFCTIVRPHCSTSQMWSIATDGVAWSVDLSVGHDFEPCRNG